MKKRLIALAMSAAMILGVLTGCGGSSGGSSGSSGSGSSGSSGEQTFNLRIHSDYTEDHPSAILMTEFTERVKEKTNGTVNIKCYYAGALGDYTTVFDEVAKGSIDMTFGCNSTTAGLALNIWNMPYLAPTWDAAKTVYAPGGFVSDTMKELCDETGIKMLSLHFVGAGGLAGTKMPKDWETWGVDHDFLLRVPNAATSVMPMSAMGYRTQAINWSELFTSVQTGVVDGFVGGHPPVAYDQFRDVIKYWIQINNFFEVATIAINKATFEKMSTSQQEALQEAADWAFQQSVERGEETENDYLQKLEDYGITVIKPDTAVLESFAQHCREEVWPELRSEIDNDEIFDGLMAEMGL